jgi:hypothetical protein
MNPPGVAGANEPMKGPAGGVGGSGVEGRSPETRADAGNSAAGERDAAIGSGVSKTREVIDEFRSVVLGQGRILDAVLPSVIFLVTRALASDAPAMLAALVTGASIVLFRVVRRQPSLTAVFGLLGSLLAFVIAQSSHRAELFFLPDTITNVALAAACLISAAVRRPLVAWTSHLVRRWPREWYWHPRVLPAYRETTLAWAAIFLLQAALQWTLILRQDITLAAISSLLNGWPATALLLVVTYLYGTWRLPRLAGPSVVEFQNGSVPPWTGQQRGF